MSRSCILIGFPGCGKTTYGRGLAELLDQPFADTDELLLERFGKGENISAFHKRVGEERFREHEYQVLSTLQHPSPQVIATGGGILSTQKNFSLLKELGLMIYLKTPLRILTERLLQRGLPTFCEGKDPYDSLTLLMQQRSPLYEAAADKVIHTFCLNPEDVLQELYKLYV